MHRVRMLLHFGIIPFLVFDGDYLPSKAGTEEGRSKTRKESKKFGMELLNAGKTSQAYLELQKAIEVTPEMARQLIEELKKTGVRYVVAPYEADAQMTYLERKGVISAILSEDSDLLVFGAKVLLTKLDQYGNCIEINRADFCACREINLTGWSDKEFRRMAILSGCDYLTNINSMGLKTAYRMIRKYKTIEKILQMLQFEGKYQIPEGYLEAFYQAELTFLYQRVYCPLSNTIVFHTQPDRPISDGEMPFIGAYVEPAVARGVATGELDPMTKGPIIPQSSQKATKSQQLRHTLTPGDPEKGVSIEKYFKPKRIPLGEMDPNCFSQTSNQDRRLAPNSARWPEDLPRPYIYPSNARQEPQLPQPTPNKTQSSTAGRVPGTASISETRPSKRARLCAGSGPSDVSSNETGVLLERSRFFNTSTLDPTPLVAKSAKVKRSNKEDCFTIYSDDSIDQALLSLPDYDDWNSKVTNFNKATKAQSSLSHPHTSNEAQCKLLDGDQSSNSQSLPNSAQAASVESSVSIPSTPVKPSLQSSFSCLKEKFTFIPPAFSRQKPCAIQTPPSSIKPSRIPLAVKSPTLSKQHPRVLTPLQKLGIKALGISELQTPPYTPIARNSTIKRLPAFAKSKFVDPSSVPFPEVAIKARIEPTPTDPAVIPMAQPDGENISLALNVSAINDSVNTIGETKVKGSEDLIVYDSEDEYD